MEEAIDLAPIREQLTAYPPLGRALSEEAEARPPLVGGFSLALAQTFKTLT